MKDAIIFMINSWIQYQILLSTYQQEKFKISASGLLGYFVTVHRFIGSGFKGFEPLIRESWMEKAWE